VKKIITVVFGVTFLVLGLTACGGGDEIDVAMDAMENFIDIVENDLIPAAEEVQELKNAMEEKGLEPSESQRKRMKDLMKRGQRLETTINKLDAFDFIF
jgi:hypothetical protein